jgi:hypothetical protein
MNLYLKMGATADEIQMGRFKICNTVVRCCRPGKYEEEDLLDFLPVQGLSDEEKASQVEEFAWVPTHVDLQEVFFSDRRNQGSKKLEDEVFKRWREENPGQLEKVNEEIPLGDRWNAITLLYFMYRRFNKTWDWERQCWEKIIF